MNHSNIDDLTLASLLCKGDIIAFVTIYDRYRTQLYRQAYKYIGMKEESEDIVQNTFISLWNNRTKNPIRNNLKQYLFSSINNQVNSYMRTTIRWRENIKDVIQLMRPYENSTEEAVTLSDLHSLITRSSANLPQKCKVAFHLSRFEHFSIQDIAETMKISRRTVENYIALALKKLHSDFESFYQ